jgi:hypothetical protein
MPAPIETFRSYGALLQRLFPQLSHALIAGANGTVLWVSDPQAARSLDGTRSLLVRSGTDRPDDIDGLADTDAVAARFGFRVRATHGDPLAYRSAPRPGGGPCAAKAGAGLHAERTVGAHAAA